MTSRTDEIADFLAQNGWSKAQKAPLAGDASARRYERLTMFDGKKAVLMDAPPEAGQTTAPFVDMARHLTALGVSAPDIYAADTQRGLLLIEDLGDALFARMVTQDSQLERPLYEAAADVLTTLHKHPAPTGLATMDAQTLGDMIEPVFSWYVAGVDREWQKPWKIFQEEIHPILAEHIGAPDTLVLRDYHAENLLWLPDRKGIARVGVLDFQDALLGHRAYDLVSLLQDARRDVPHETESHIKAHFVQASDIDPESFDIAYSLLGAQRNLRIIGVFARLCMHFGKPHYVDMIPRVYDLAIRNLQHPLLKGPADLLSSTLPAPTPDLLKTLKAKCATVPTP